MHIQSSYKVFPLIRERFTKRRLADANSLPILLEPGFHFGILLSISYRETQLGAAGP
jgi:hypothetical protein